MGFGDKVGLACTHSVAACMNGIKTAGDMVLRMQLLKGMRIDEAKKYVAEKLGVSVEDLCDCAVMEEVRENLNIGLQRVTSGPPTGLEMKARISKILDIPINVIEQMKARNILTTV